LSVSTRPELERLLERVAPVELDLLDRRSALQRRTDTKYVATD